MAKLLLPPGGKILRLPPSVPARPRRSFLRLGLLCLALILSLGLLVFRSTTFWNLLSPITQKSLLYELAGQYKIDPLLLFSMERHESDLNPFAQSSAGARGLLQLLPATAEEEAALMNLDYQNEDDLYRQDVNLRLGVHYFSRLLRAFDGNLVLALASYNAGITKVKSWGLLPFGRDQDELIEEIPVEETRNYVRRVLGSYHRYKRLQKIKRMLHGEP
jgi:soluble lytic murein transglycosylase